MQTMQSYGTSPLTHGSHSKTKRITLPQAVSGAMMKLYTNRRHTDVVFIVGPEKVAFRAHQLFLAAQSSVFDSIFYDEMETRQTPTTPTDNKYLPASRPSSQLSPSKSPITPLSCGEHVVDPINSIFQICETFSPTKTERHPGKSPISPQPSKVKKFLIPDVDPEVFSTFLQFLYSGEIFIDDQLALPLLSLSNAYQIHSLKLICSEFVSDQITTQSVVRYLEDSVKYDIPFLYDKCFTFILDHFVNVVETDQFLEDISEGQLKKILQSDDVNADELCLFVALVRWGIRQVSMRPNECEFVGVEQILSNLLKHVRWYLMAPNEIADVVRPMKIAPVEDLFDALAVHYSKKKYTTNLRKGSKIHTSINNSVTLMKKELQLLREQQAYISPLPTTAHPVLVIDPVPFVLNTALTPPPPRTVTLNKRIREAPDLLHTASPKLKSPPVHTIDPEKKEMRLFTLPSVREKKSEKRKSEPRFRKGKSTGKIRPQSRDEKRIKTTPNTLSTKSSSWMEPQISVRSRSDSESRMGPIQRRSLETVNNDILDPHQTPENPSLNTVSHRKDILPDQSQSLSFSPETFHKSHTSYFSPNLPSLSNNSKLTTRPQFFSVCSEPPKDRLLFSSQSGFSNETREKTSRVSTLSLSTSLNSFEKRLSFNFASPLTSGQRGDKQSRSLSPRSDRLSDRKDKVFSLFLFFSFFFFLFSFFFFLFSVCLS
jgi:hypothetical protein